MTLSVSQTDKCVLLKQCLVGNYFLRNSPEERISHFLRDGNLKSLSVSDCLPSDDWTIQSNKLECLRKETDVK